MGKVMQSEESFRGSILEVGLEIQIFSIPVVEKNDEKMCPRQTWKKWKTFCIQNVQ